MYIAANYYTTKYKIVGLNQSDLNKQLDQLETRYHEIDKRIEEQAFNILSQNTPETDLEKLVEQRKSIVATYEIYINKTLALYMYERFLQNPDNFLKEPVLNTLMFHNKMQRLSETPVGFDFLHHYRVILSESHIL